MRRQDRTPRPQPRSGGASTPPAGVRQVQSEALAAQSRTFRDEPPPGTARYRRDQALVLPLWSLALMVVLVAFVAGAVVALVLALGGGDAPDEPPVVVMRSAVPTERPAAFPAVPVTPTLPPFAERGDSPPQGAFALAGPTLATPVITPTPRPVDIGAPVVVIDVGDQQLNVRDRAGVFETTILFRVPEGTAFTVVEGPLQVDGLTWWRIQSVTNPSQTGWAAANYLQVPPDGS